MRFEKINEDKISCHLNTNDLEKLGINLFSLAHGSPEAKSLFTLIMSKAERELNFEFDGHPLMIEATPLEDKSLILFISKVEDPEEIDPRFSTFSASDKEKIDNDKLLSSVENHNKDIFVDENEFSKSKKKNAFRFFRFKDLDTLISATKSISPRFVGPSIAYKNPNNNMYYLIINGKKLSLDDFNFCLINLSEYGELLALPKISKAHFDEHFKIFVPNNAVDKLSSIKD